MTAMAKNIEQASCLHQLWSLTIPALRRISAARNASLELRVSADSAVVQALHRIAHLQVNAEGWGLGGKAKRQEGWDD